MTDNFIFSFSDIDITILALLAALLIALSFHCIRLRSVLTKWIRREAFSSSDSDTANLSSVSVIVYADGSNSSYLTETIPAIIQQDYEDFEVIVVNADGSDVIDEILTQLIAEYPSLRTTFIPDSSVNVSVRKLAIMLGIKAAKNDIVLLTSANCRPTGNEWIKSMSRHFADPSTGIVIGYCRQSIGSGFGHRYRLFDNVADSAAYLYYACKNAPFRGTRNNIAYRARLFYDNKGFSQTMNLKYGDDDIFITEIAKYTDTEAEFSQEGIVEDIAVSSNNDFCQEKEHRYFTLSKIKPTALTAQTAMTLVRGVFLLSAVASLALPTWYFINGDTDYVKIATMGISAVIAYLVEEIIYISAWRKEAKILGYKRLLFTIPFFRLIRPILNLYFHSKAPRSANHVWE